ncbi:MAG: hypothetical protein L3J03_09905 [Desulfobacterales bacterium]|nr:hypothetical protein [Desulfobacterales bacterium]
MNDLDEKIRKIREAMNPPEIKKLVPSLDLRECSLLFQETGNPVYVWKGYKICREFEFEFPPWLLVYFDEVADNILSIEFDGQKRLASLLQDALLMNRGKGASNIIDQPKEIDHRLKAYLKVNELKERRQNGEMIKGSVYSIVGSKLNKSPEWVKKYYQKIKKIADKPI